MRKPGLFAWTSTAMLPGLCSLASIFSWARGMSSQLKTSTCRVDPALHNQLVGLSGLHEIGEMATLDPLLAHPDEAGVHGQVVAGRAGAEDNHAPALDHEATDREGLLAGMLEDEIDIVALAGVLPDRLAENLRHFRMNSFHCTRDSLTVRQAGPST